MAAPTFTAEQVEFLLAQKANPNLVPPHGSNALLNDGTVRPDMYSTVPKVSRFMQVIPMKPSRVENELYEILTGQTASTGSNPSSTCDPNAPQDGNLKVCRQTIPYGQFWKSTKPFNVANAAFRKNYADNDRRIVNPEVLMDANPLVPDVMSAAGNINSPLGKNLIEFGYGTSKDFAYVHINGNSSKNNTQTRLGFIAEHEGLLRLIKTGHTDSVSGDACAAADSLVIDYNDVELGAGFVQTLSDAYRTQRMTGEIVGMADFIGAFVVHPYLKYPLIDIWACNYHTARCEPSDSNGRVINTETVTRLREDMTRGNYLLIDGEEVPLLYDAAMPITQNQTTGKFTGGLLYVPLSWAGRDLLYMQYLPANVDWVSDFVNDGFNQFRVMNNGLYISVYYREGTCYRHLFAAHTRLILDAPFLALRIDDIVFTSTTKFRTPFTTDPYYVDGGVYLRS